ncbi:hypothetical protein AAFF_G00409630 [Aldrovandia affinis]|uniref:Uncharacterized protein n=1 Tax=Aldrovandia affinis TaxID=143900 RepID=A0AAD7WJT4_9TELE|nr:hypothetical protein AAFF_G00409630 [Aldrovandia affinis]
MDELRSLVAKDNDFHSTSVFAFVETHLSPLVPDETVELEGFSMFRADRDFELLGNSDHDLIHLVPRYRQRLKLSKPVVRRVKVWSSEARERLSAWLERAGCDQGLMEWAGPEAGNNLDEYTDTVISFISFCEEVCVPVRTRKIYNNDKPWFTAQLRRLRSEKEEARRSGDKDRFKEAKYRFAKAAKEANTASQRNCSSSSLRESRLRLERPQNNNQL